MPPVRQTAGALQNPFARRRIIPPLAARAGGSLLPILQARDARTPAAGVPARLAGAVADGRPGGGETQPILTLARAQRAAHRRHRFLPRRRRVLVARPTHIARPPGALDEGSTGPAVPRLERGLLRRGRA